MTDMRKYSTWGHQRALAEAEKAGIEKAGGTADLYQIPETLSAEVLAKMYAPGQPDDIPLLEDPATLEKYDGFLIGIATRYGNFPTQWRTFWDKTGSQWQGGGYYQKFAGLFITTAVQGGGQESTAIAAMSTLAHHGIIYVPLGYPKVMQELSTLTEVRGGSPWGAGAFTSLDGSRQPSPTELSMATKQGEEFYTLVAKHVA